MAGKKRKGGRPQEEIVPDEESQAGVEEVAPPPDNNDETVPEASKGYRTTQRQGENARKRRKTALSVLLVLLLAAAAALAVWRWQDVKDVARRVGDGISSLWEDEQGGQEGKTDLFTINPLTGQQFQDSSINTLICLTADNQVRSLLYVSRAQDGTMEYFFVPEDIVGKAQDGSDLSLSGALAANPERTVELRYMVEGLTGKPVHFVVVLPLRSLLFLADSMGFPTVRVNRDTEVYNPFTGAREKLTAGQELKDTDRILSYLLAEGDPDEYGSRSERGASYLPGLMEMLADWTQADLATALLGQAGTFQLTPSTSGQGESADYLAPLIAAWAGGGGGDPVFFSAPQIEILNGCGVVGAGTDMKAQLESHGFKVAEAGKNAKVVEGGQEYNDFSHQASVIRYASGDPPAEAYARYLAMLFKIPRVERSEDSSGITIIVGSDLATPSPDI